MIYTKREEKFDMRLSGPRKARVPFILHGNVMQTRLMVLVQGSWVDGWSVIESLTNFTTLVCGLDHIKRRFLIKRALQKVFP